LVGWAAVRGLAGLAVTSAISLVMVLDYTAGGSLIFYKIML